MYFQVLDKFAVDRSVKDLVRTSYVCAELHCSIRSLEPSEVGRLCYPSI